MKKLLVLLGIGVGFIAGSRVGKAPYEKLTNALRGVTGRPEVGNVVDTVSQKVDEATDKVAAKVDDVTDKAGTKVDQITAKVS
jgi:hypothetical protein